MFPPQHKCLPQNSKIHITKLLSWQFCLNQSKDRNYCLCHPINMTMYAKLIWEQHKCHGERRASAGIRDNISTELLNIMSFQLSNLPGNGSKTSVVSDKVPECGIIVIIFIPENSFLLLLKLTVDQNRGKSNTFLFPIPHSLCKLGRLASSGLVFSK